MRRRDEGAVGVGDGIAGGLGGAGVGVVGFGGGFGAQGGAFAGGGHVCGIVCGLGEGIGRGGGYFFRLEDLELFGDLAGPRLRKSPAKFRTGSERIHLSLSNHPALCSYQAITLSMRLLEHLTNGYLYQSPLNPSHRGLSIDTGI